MSAQVYPITDQIAEDWLQRYPARFLACRQGHNFPKLVPGQKRFVRTTIEFHPDKPGIRIVTQWCTCGRVRYRRTDARGVWDGPWRYKDPDGYAQPPGYGRTRADFARVYWGRIIGDWDESESAIEDALQQEANSGT